MTSDRGTPAPGASDTGRFGPVPGRYEEAEDYYRRSLEIRISSLLEQCGDGGPGLSLAFVDIDHFKVLNDTMGHEFGDDCLQMLRRVMRDILPDDAVLGRFGGDEFLVLLLGADYFRTRELLERLNPGLQERMVEEDISLTVSVGIAGCLSGEETSIAEFLKKADLSLYAAKAAGRGCVGAKADAGPTG